MKKFLLSTAAIALLGMPVVAFAQSNPQTGAYSTSPSKQENLVNSHVDIASMSMHIRIVTASAPVAVSNNDMIVEINKGTPAATAVSLPTALGVGETHIIVDGAGNANSDNITITPASGNINGAGTYVINTAKGTAKLVWDGVQWVLW